MQIRRGKIGSGTEIADSGAIVEYTISASPPLRNTVRAKRFKVALDVNDYQFIGIEEVSG